MANVEKMSIIKYIKLILTLNLKPTNILILIKL